MQYVEIVLPIGLLMTFTYAINDDVDSAVGKRALVNFNGRKITGYIISVVLNKPSFKVKPVEKIIDEIPIFTQKMIDFAQWISGYYFCSVGEALSLMVPRGIRPSYKEDDSETLQKTCLTEQQQDCINGIEQDIKNGISRFYLYGITGSGKTEIYFDLIEKTLSAGKSVIFLVPEIALSYQTTARMKKRFGSQCATLHSQLKGSVKLGEYLKLLNGKASIAIGPRSALFAPLDNIGLIIIDEEHDGSYKSDESPRFHARSAAMHLAQTHKSILVFGSATPSVESWYYAQNGFLKLYVLNERYGGAMLPDITVIDTSTIPYGRNISPILREEINIRLKKNEQILLLQNRRGFANYIQCDSCKKAIVCQRCSISMTYHKSNDLLVCHRCGYKHRLPPTCPDCGNNKFIKIGAGTQKIEEEIEHIFPHAKIARIDYDSVTNSISDVFAKIENRELDIIIGTQMIAKGLDFPGIKFVGIINADTFLNIPDFKAAERAYSLITQVSGRAGRTGEKGLVMIQTMNPEHYSITSALNSDYRTFYNTEIGFRQLLNMPPFLRMTRLVTRSHQEEKALKAIEEIFKTLNSLPHDSVEILGPSPCMLSKINKNFRFQLLLKSTKIDSLQSLIKTLLTKFTISHNVYLEIDVDPTDLY